MIEPDMIEPFRHEKLLKLGISGHKSYHSIISYDGLKDYRPINLIHAVGKLFTKGLALRLTPRMSELVMINQSTFIRGRRIHENFHTV